MKNVDHYQILGVERRAAPEEIRNAFRRLAKKHHPDVSEEKTQSTLQMQRINAAYQVLQDKEERRKYDAQLRMEIQVANKSVVRRSSKPRSTTPKRTYNTEQKQCDRIRERIVYHVKGYYEELIKEHPARKEELLSLLDRQISIVVAYSRSGEDEDALWRWAEKAKQAASKIGT